MKRGSIGTPPPPPPHLQSYGQLPPLPRTASQAAKSKSVIQLHGSGGWFVVDEEQQRCSAQFSATRCEPDRPADGFERRFSIDVGEMLNNSNSQHQDLLCAWLDRFGYKNYSPNFINAGYDLQTISRMTPEDLTAIGITNPEHRKKITSELQRFHVPDTWPSYRPCSVGQWLHEIGLHEYATNFQAQQCSSVDDLLMLNWEDFEEMGVKKLGHLKRLVLAAKKLQQTHKEHRASVGTESTPTSRATAEIRPFSHVCSFGHADPALFCRSSSLSDSCGNLKTFQSSPFRKASTSRGLIKRFSNDRLDGNLTVVPGQKASGPPPPPTQMSLSPAMPRRSTAVVHPLCQLQPNRSSVGRNVFSAREISKSQELSSFCGSVQNITENGTVNSSDAVSCFEKKRSQSTSSTSSPATPLFRLSNHWGEECNTMDGQSTLVEDLPPPPSLLCEQSIKALRDMRRKLPNKSNTEDFVQPDTAMLGGGGGGAMSRSVESELSNVFHNDQRYFEQPQIVVDTHARRTSSSRTRSAEGLDDIESMLQNLSDQLDALLIHPAA